MNEGYSQIALSIKD